MPTHVALLRGINVGRSVRIPMAGLRELVERLGHTQVKTYVQSGNVVLTPATGQARSVVELATELSDAVQDEFGVHPHVIVLAATDWEQVVAGNPYGQQEDPTKVHAAVQQEAIGADHEAMLAAVAARSRAEGSPDELSVNGRVMYLHTPDGLGRSVLGQLLSRSKGAGQDRSTMRNWRSVLAIQALLAQD